MDDERRTGVLPQAEMQNSAADTDAPDSVAAVWSEVLGGQPVGLDDDLFFDLGGNSLVGVAIVARLAAATGLPLELRDLYLAPTPRELAGQLALLRTGLTALLARVEPAGNWNVELFAEALAELGPSAAELFLPVQARIQQEGDGGVPVAGAARVAVLRRARGNGTCVAETGLDAGPGGEPVVAIRRQDAVVQIRVEGTEAEPILRLVEVGAGAPNAADPE